MTLEFDKTWTDLNERLRELEHGSGLTAAMRALETYHLQTGFIQDNLLQVERHTFYHPDDPERFFRVQYNPRRAKRFAGSGDANGHKATLNNGCFLCRENIEIQQDGAQLGYEIMTDGRTYLALTNPFPLLPEHIVIASREHRTQDWSLHDPRGIRTTDLIGDLVYFAHRMPGHLAFYNGVDAGASISGHLHFQCLLRPPDEPAFPLEVAGLHADGRYSEPGHLDTYPLDAVVWRGTSADVAMRASGWLNEWAERNHPRLATLSANIIALRERSGENLLLFFVPRERGRSRPEGFSGLIGGLEVLGEIVLSSEADKAWLDSGEIDYFRLETILASVRTPLELE
jgi:hypothetical protein